MAEFTVHGYTFNRSGECAQCGACGCGECPHHYTENGKHGCTVYYLRHLHCEQCETDHAGCIQFPDNPWIHVVRGGVCGYQFERADGGPMDDLPFLNGEPYRWP